MNYNKIEDIMMDLQLMTPLETIVEKIQADERAKTVEWLVENGYIKKGFDVKYLLDVMNKVER